MVAERQAGGNPLAREVGAEIYRLENWKDRALGGIDTNLRERGGDPLEKELDASRQKIGDVASAMPQWRLFNRGRSRN